MMLFKYTFKVYGGLYLDLANLWRFDCHKTRHHITTHQPPPTNHLPMIAGPCVRSVGCVYALLYTLDCNAQWVMRHLYSLKIFLVSYALLLMILECPTT